MAPPKTWQDLCNWRWLCACGGVLFLLFGGLYRNDYCAQVENQAFSSQLQGAAKASWPPAGKDVVGVTTEGTGSWFCRPLTGFSTSKWDTYGNKVAYFFTSAVKRFVSVFFSESPSSSSVYTMRNAEAPPAADPVTTASTPPPTPPPMDDIGASAKGSEADRAPAPPLPTANSIIDFRGAWGSIMSGGKYAADVSASYMQSISQVLRTMYDFPFHFCARINLAARPLLDQVHKAVAVAKDYITLDVDTYSLHVVGFVVAVVVGAVLLRRLCLAQPQPQPQLQPQYGPGQNVGGLVNQSLLDLFHIFVTAVPVLVQPMWSALITPLGAVQAININAGYFGLCALQNNPFQAVTVTVHIMLNGVLVISIQNVVMTGAGAQARLQGNAVPAAAGAGGVHYFNGFCYRHLAGQNPEITLFIV